MKEKTYFYEIVTLKVSKKKIFNKESQDYFVKKLRPWYFSIPGKGLNLFTELFMVNLIYLMSSNFVEPLLIYDVLNMLNRRFLLQKSFGFLQAFQLTSFLKAA